MMAVELVQDQELGIGPLLCKSCSQVVELRDHPLGEQITQMIKEIIRGLPLLNLFLTHLNQLAMSSASLSVPFSSSEISTFPKASLHSSPLNSHPA
jgi:hypothetical protein